MVIHSRPTLWIGLSLVVSLVAFGCGKKDDDDDDAAPAKYGELKTSLLASTEVRSADMTTGTCTANSDTGLFTGVFTGGSGELLDIKIKDFSKTARTFTCVQPETNRDGDLGEKYTGCAVEFAIPDGTLGLNTYSSYRSLETQGAFTYSDTCTITTSYTAPKLTLNVTCANLIQTKYHGTARNPISPSEVGSLASGTTVECSI